MLNEDQPSPEAGGVPNVGAGGVPGEPPHGPQHGPQVLQVTPEEKEAIDRVSGGKDSVREQNRG